MKSSDALGASRPRTAGTPLPLARAEILVPQAACVADRIKEVQTSSRYFVFGETGPHEVAARARRRIPDVNGKKLLTRFYTYNLEILPSATCIWRFDKSRLASKDFRQESEFERNAAARAFQLTVIQRVHTGQHLVHAPCTTNDIRTLAC